uniref:Uncharacterized protein n=1 Tax=Anguilla anguilla TaxID=7936 RepID=A0A0E9W6X1_ANGAN
MPLRQGVTWQDGIPAIAILYTTTNNVCQCCMEGTDKAHCIHFFGVVDNGPLYWLSQADTGRYMAVLLTNAEAFISASVSRA